ncbi:MAG: thioredoxin family protein [Cyclobacteriaceae bacterium]|nr:thioredoxin family protein [Cyclobacteriaceae bacterium]
MNIIEYQQRNTGRDIISYPDFINWIDQLVESGSTSGLNQSEALVQFTKLNLSRMLRIHKTFIVDAAWRALSKEGFRKQQWVVITEAWCGDSAQILPIIHKISENSQGKIELNIVLRDQHPELMEKYHTNGSRSIPKLIAFDEQGNELFAWGPRPVPAQLLFANWKKILRDAHGKILKKRSIPGMQKIKEIP